MNEYASRIKRAYQGELVGEALYRRLSEVDGVPNLAHNHKLALIAKVEACTSNVLKPIANRLGVVVSREEIELTVDRRSAELRLLSWPEFIARALKDWPPYLEQLEALARSAPACDWQSARLVVDHERALVEFAHLEHASEAESLAPLEAFLVSFERIAFSAHQRDQ